MKHGWFKILLCIFLASCAASDQVLDLIDLPPPQNVRAERRGEQIIVRWQPGRERRRGQFAGYRLFIARHSLATTPVRELPPPVVLPATDTTFALTAKDTAKLFLHLRSYMDRQRLSLPSLPEAIVPAKIATKYQNPNHKQISNFNHQRPRKRQWEI